MANITITIPDAQFTRVLDALSKAYGWKTSDGLKEEFVQTALAAQIETMVLQVEKSAAELVAMASVSTPVDLGIS